MKVNSTGLGKTTLIANFGVLGPAENAVPEIKMTIESTQPIHWHITVILDGADLRQFIGIVLKPRLIIHVLKMLIAPTPKPLPVETKPAPVSKPAMSTASKSATETKSMTNTH